MGIFDDGIGGFVTSITGGKNKTNVKAPELDPNAYEYGGQAGGARVQAGAYGNTAANAQGRDGAQVNYGQTNADRAQQGQVAAMMYRRAAGQTPSIAQMQADRQMQQAQTAQASMAASARGPAAMALAQQNAANNTAQTQANISGQAQVNAANEQLQAEQSAMGAYSGMRGQSAQEAQYQAGLQQQQHQLNDQTSLGYSQLQNQVNTTQLQAQGNRMAQKSANELGAAGINAGVAGQNASMNQQNGMGLVGMVANTAAGYAGMPGKASGGPVEGRHPYLVGEEGPELIVPKHDGVVIPAGPTAALLGRPVPRESGGPVEAGGAPAMLAPPTWGTSRGVSAEDIARQNQESEHRLALGAEHNARLAAGGGQMGGLAVAGFSPGISMSKSEPLIRRDEDAVATARAKEAEGAEVTGREAYNAAGAEYRLANEKRAAAKAGAAHPSKKASIGEMLGTIGKSASEQATQVDTSYHGPGGYVPPMLVPIGGARSGGGPISAGGSPAIGGMVDIGGGGSGMSADMIKAASTGRMGGGMVGGGGIVGGSNVPGGFGGTASGALGGIGAAARQMAASVDTSYQPIAVPRESGGPIQAGGEPEVIALYEPPGKELHQSFDGRAFYRDAPSVPDDRPSLAGPASIVAMMSRPQAKAKPATVPRREKTPEELMREADELEARMRGEHEQRMGAGPAIMLRRAP